MWKEYSISYIKNNKTSSVSIMVASLISAIFFSLITCVFYNMWIGNINKIVKEEGDWHAKIKVSITEKDSDKIQGVDNVKKIETIATENGSETIVYFYDMRSIYEDMPIIAKLIEVDESAIQYHDTLLSQYFIFNPSEESHPLLLAFFMFVMILVCISLILIIRNAFLVSMQSRLHQLGILQSIGATPRQIRICLLQEALALCLIPILIGIGCGVALCILISRIANGIVTTYGGDSVVFTYHFALFLIALLATIFTVLCSAWLPARKLSKMNPLQVIKGEEEKDALRKEKKFFFASFLFGVEGELARKSLYLRRKALRTTTVSLTLAFSAFSIFLSFITLSGISTKYTYFEIYKDSWDIMATVKNQNINDIENLFNVSTLNQVDSCSIYQKATCYTWITEDMFSDDLKKLGGISAVAGSNVKIEDNKYKVKVPMVILDDKSFFSYCGSLGINLGSTKEGMITINRLWDSINSNFRYKNFIPFIKEQDNMVLSLFQSTDRNNDGVRIPILAFTDKVPVLREEYDNYGLVQVISASTWQNFMDNINVDSDETYINVLTKRDEDIKVVQAKMEHLLSGKNYEIENRIEEELFNQEIQKGYTLIMGGLCSLLAIIGLANVFSNTLGFIYQRKREFARYISIGLTPQGMKKILCIEALVIGGKPIIITIPLTILFVLFATRASYINPMEFYENMPVISLTIFACMILACVWLAYYIGGRRICKSNIIESLKNVS